MYTHTCMCAYKYMYTHTRTFLLASIDIQKGKIASCEKTISQSTHLN